MSLDQMPRFSFPVKFPLVPSTRAYFLASAAPDLPTVGTLTLEGERMTETQDDKTDKTADVKTLYKEPHSKQRNLSFDSIGCYCSPSPASRPQILAAAACSPL